MILYNKIRRGFKIAKSTSKLSGVHFWSHDLDDFFGSATPCQKCWHTGRSSLRLHYYTTSLCNMSNLLIPLPPRNGQGLTNSWKDGLLYKPSTARWEWDKDLSNWRKQQWQPSLHTLTTCPVPENALQSGKYYYICF